MDSSRFTARSFEGFINALRDPACYVSLDGRVLISNATANEQKMFQTARHFVEGLPHSATDQITAALEQCFKQGHEMTTRFMLGASTPTETPPCFDIYLTPVLIGDIATALVICRKASIEYLRSPLQETLTKPTEETVQKIAEPALPPKPTYPKLVDDEAGALLEELHASRAGLESTTDQIFILDEKRSITWANAAARQFMDGKHLGTDAIATLAPQDQVTFKQVEKSLQNGTTCTYRACISISERPEKPERLWFRCQLLPIRRTGTRSAVLIATDITATVAAAEAAADPGTELAVLRTLVHMSPVPIFFKNASGKYTAANQATTTLLGKTADDIVGKVDRDILPAAIADTVRHTDKEVITNRTSKLVEEKTINGRGEERTMYSRKFPVIDGNGVAIAVGTVSVDITDRKIAEEEAQNLNSIINASKEFLIITTLDGSPIFINRSCTESLGWSKNVSTLAEFVTPNIAQKFFKEIFPEVAKAGKVWEGECEFINKTTGEQVPVWQRVVLLKDNSGKPKSLAIVATDLRSIHTANRMLSDAAKMSSLGAMAGGIAHEINNPLAIIYGKSCQVRKLAARGDISPSELAMELEKIESTAVRISKIIKGLRAFSRSGERDPMVDVPLATILEDTLSFCQERFRNNGIELNVAKTPDLSIRCRSIQIAQVLLNLMHNSFEAMQNLPEKWIDIQVESEAEVVRIAVVDSGKGASPKTIEHMMEPLFNAKDGAHSMALGLRVAKVILEEHGGKFAYAPLDGHTRFILELPAVRASSKGEAA